MGSGHGHRTREAASDTGAKLARGERDRDGLPKILATLGTLDVRLATSEREIRLGQKLRYQVFFVEGGAIANPIARLTRRDICRFDRLCEHLIAVDNSAPRFDGAPTVVGAYLGADDMALPVAAP